MRPILLALGLALAPSIADAQFNSFTKRLRAVRAPTAAIDKVVAEGAKPTVLEEAKYPDAGNMTATRIIGVLCGQVRQPYIDSLESVAENREILQSAFGTEKLPMDKPLGPSTYRLQWPACLVVTPAAAVRIGPGDSPEKIYRRLTGDNGSRAAVADFFGLEYSDLAKKKLGDELTPARRTISSKIEVITPELAQRLDELSTAATKASDPALLTISETPDPQASPPPMLLIGTGSVAAITRPAECVGAEPHSATYYTRVANAFKHTARMRRSRRKAPQPVEIMVVDNGFLGAVKTAAGVRIQPGFTEELIAARYAGNVGPSMFAGVKSPLIQPPTPWDDVAGHGTHVASLAMGGPSFAGTVKDLLSSDLYASLLTVSMVNVGDGRRELLRGSPTELRNLIGLSTFRIMNFSLEYTDRADNDVKGNFEAVFKNDTAKLFVAAAGNAGVQTTGRFPAAFGGPSASNVITVGATLPDGSLAAFSNWGETTVDVAAPGCDVMATIDQNATIRGLSGTSQAAPQVSFAAALLRVLGGDAAGIKTRIVVSGSLIKPPPPGTPRRTRLPGLIASMSQLDLERSLYVYNDYVELGDGREYLGTVDRLDGAECVARSIPSAKTVAQIWAFKKAGDDGWLVTGREASKHADPPCAWVKDTGALAFKATHRIWDDGVKLLTADDPAGTGPGAMIEVPLGTVRRLLVGSDIDEVN